MSDILDEIVVRAQQAVSAGELPGSQISSLEWVVWVTSQLEVLSQVLLDEAKREDLVAAAAKCMLASSLCAQPSVLADDDELLLADVRSRLEASVDEKPAPNAQKVAGALMQLTDAARAAREGRDTDVPDYLLKTSGKLVTLCQQA